jgi:hypothetical protein
MPVHATVRTFGLSSVPQDTITGGSGAKRAPPFYITFANMHHHFSAKININPNDKARRSNYY